MPVTASWPAVNAAFALSISPMPTRQIARCKCGGGYSGLSLIAARRPTRTLNILFRAETCVGQHIVGDMVPRLSRVQPQDLLQMFDCVLGFTDDGL